MAENRPKVSLDGTIRFGLTERQKKLIEENGLDPDEAVVMSDNGDSMIVRINHTYYALEWGGEDDG